MKYLSTKRNLSFFKNLSSITAFKTRIQFYEINVKPSVTSWNKFLLILIFYLFTFLIYIYR